MGNPRKKKDTTKYDIKTQVARFPFEFIQKSPLLGGDFCGVTATHQVISAFKTVLPAPSSTQPSYETFFGILQEGYLLCRFFPQRLASPSSGLLLNKRHRAQENPT